MTKCKKLREIAGSRVLGNCGKLQVVRFGRLQEFGGNSSGKLWDFCGIEEKLREFCDDSSHADFRIPSVIRLDNSLPALYPENCVAKYERSNEILEF